MLDFVAKDRSPMELEVYNNIVAFLASYGMLVLVAILILMVFNQFNKLMSIQVKDVLILIAIMAFLDYLFPLELIDKTRLGILHVLTSLGGTK